jgi:hypothetical protein
MNAARSATTLPPALFSELAEFLRTTGSSVSAHDAMISAVKQWIAAERAATMPSRGYQWKRLFLPAGTRLRMHYAGSWFYAEVLEDQLIYRGRAVSPRQLTIEIAGDGRNAWRDLWVLLPGEHHWTSAARLRDELDQNAPAEPPSPMQAMQLAARSMSQALQSALALVDHAKHEAEQMTERRIPKHRRRADYELDDYKAD